MDEYDIIILSQAFEDLQRIDDYISNTLLEPETAMRLISEMENAIQSLGLLPNRCPERKIGEFANRGYRQLFVKNYTVIYRVDEEKRQVLVVTVRYARSSF